MDRRFPLWLIVAVSLTAAAVVQAAEPDARRGDDGPAAGVERDDAADAWSDRRDRGALDARDDRAAHGVGGPGEGDRELAATGAQHAARRPAQAVSAGPRVLPASICPRSRDDGDMSVTSVAGYTPAVSAWPRAPLRHCNEEAV